MKSEAQTMTLQTQPNPSQTAIGIRGLIEVLGPDGKQRIRSWQVQLAKCTLGSSSLADFHLPFENLAPTHLSFSFGRTKIAVKAISGSMKIQGKLVNEWLFDQPTTIGLGEVQLHITPAAYLAPIATPPVQVPKAKVEPIVASDAYRFDAATTPSPTWNGSDFLDQALPRIEELIRQSLAPLRGAVESLKSNIEEIKKSTRPSQPRAEALNHHDMAVLEGNIAQRIDERLQILFEEVGRLRAEASQPVHQEDTQSKLAAQHLIEELDRARADIQLLQMQIEQLTQERDTANSSVEELTRQLSATCESFELHQQAANFGDEEQARMMEQLSSLDQELNHVKLTAEEQISAWQRAHSELQQQLAHWQAETQRLEEALQSQHYSTTPVQVDSYSNDDHQTAYGESSYQTNSYGYDASAVEQFEETAVGLDSEVQDSYVPQEETIAERDDRPAYGRYDEPDRYTDSYVADESEGAFAGYTQDDADQNASSYSDTESDSAFANTAYGESEVVSDANDFDRVPARASQFPHDDDDSVDGYVGVEPAASSEDEDLEQVSPFLAAFLKEQAEGASAVDAGASDAISDEPNEFDEQASDRLSKELARFSAERDRIADERDRMADERDRLADERDRIADARDPIQERIDRERLFRESEKSLREAEREALHSYSDTNIEGLAQDETQGEDESDEHFESRSAKFLSPQPAAKKPLELRSDSSDGDHSDASGEDEDSIEAYMQRLLQRVRGNSDDMASTPVISTPSRASVEVKRSRLTEPPIGEPVQSTFEATKAASKPLAKPLNKPMEEGNEETSKISMEEFVPRQAAPEKNQNMAAMRELANSTARKAIEKSDRRKLAAEAFFKAAVVIIGLAGGVVLLLLNGFRFNMALVGAISGFGVALLWGFEAIQLNKNLRKQNRERSGGHSAS